MFENFRNESINPAASYMKHEMNRTQSKNHNAEKPVALIKFLCLVTTTKIYT